ncbi:MAG: hypothetical protein LUG12_12790 [Erysipelotrichaceae bacterium]|nr:hypothetical protein [Erysipelotrichaceae bacterium]
MAKNLIDLKEEEKINVLDIFKELGKSDQTLNDNFDLYDVKKVNIEDLQFDQNIPICAYALIDRNNKIKHYLVVEAVDNNLGIDTPSPNLYYKYNEFEEKTARITILKVGFDLDNEAELNNEKELQL